MSSCLTESQVLRALCFRWLYRVPETSNVPSGGLSVVVLLRYSYHKTVMHLHTIDESLWVGEKKRMASPVSLVLFTQVSS